MLVIVLITASTRVLDFPCLPTVSGSRWLSAARVGQVTIWGGSGYREEGSRSDHDLVTSTKSRPRYLIAFVGAHLQYVLGIGGPNPARVRSQEITSRPGWHLPCRHEVLTRRFRRCFESMFYPVPCQEGPLGLRAEDCSGCAQACGTQRPLFGYLTECSVWLASLAILLEGVACILLSDWRTPRTACWMRLVLAG
jgi:hypothetical protein